MPEHPQKRSDYSSPPVIEIYIEVKFAPSEDKEDWDLDVIQPLLEEVSDRFGQQKRITKRTIHFEEANGTEPQIELEDEVLDRVQLFSDDATRCVQFGEDLLVCNLRKEGSFVPHYSQIVDSFQWALGTYISHMRPSGVQWYALNYVDLFHIPESRFELEKYFRLALDVPESMPDLTTFNYDCEFRISEGQRLSVRWKDVSAEGGHRFRVNWKLASPDESHHIHVPEILDSICDMHETLCDFFEETITEKTRALFREEEQ
jgi:uncharacterized protein (TIGR04255 family)